MMQPNNAASNPADGRPSLNMHTPIATHHVMKSSLRTTCVSAGRKAESAPVGVIVEDATQNWLRVCRCISTMLSYKGVGSDWQGSKCDYLHECIEGFIDHWHQHTVHNEARPVL